MSVENNRPSYFEMAALGFARGALPFPIEHALDRIKLESQAHPDKTTRQAAYNLWQSQGLKGLSAGSSVNLVRRVGREIYQWPVMLSINRIWKDIIPENRNKNNLATNLATGHSMAFFQACVTLPLERLLIEKTLNKGYRPFFEKMRLNGRLIIYEGFQTTWIRHTITWDLFFISNHTSSAVLKRIDPENSYPNLSYLGRSMLTSTFVVGASYPLEFLRNRILMEPEVLSTGTMNGIRTLFNRYKWKRLYSGAPIVLFQNFIQTFIVQILIDRINLK